MTSKKEEEVREMEGRAHKQSKEQLGIYRVARLFVFMTKPSPDRTTAERRVQTVLMKSFVALITQQHVMFIVSPTTLLTYNIIYLFFLSTILPWYFLRTN
jgi:hypothetical protein